MTTTYTLYQPAMAAGGGSAAPGGNDTLPPEISVQGGKFTCRHQWLDNGPSRGVDILTIQGARAGLTLVPTRGMAIWKAWCGETTYGWQSPVQGPVHPALVPTDEPSGLGWLAGFDELLTRCGLESNGAPEFDESGRVRYPLHGRLGNTPAQSLQIIVDAQQGTLEVRGVVRESRLFFTHWKLTSTIRLQVDSNIIEIEDSVTNEGDAENTHQLLYHINVGHPVLGAGARLFAPYETVVPKTPRAVEGIKTFDQYDAPEPGFAEQVYLMRLQADPQGWSGAVLRDAGNQCGLGVRFDTSTLPYFIQWKNTGGQHDGYVTGLEPATNFPNRRSFEEAQGRVVKVPAGESVNYRLQLHLLNDSQQLFAFTDQLSSLATHEGKVEWNMRDNWCE